MVCIAAFIILAIIGVFVAVISIFKPEIGKKYLKIFKRSWECLWKKVRLQKCETGFKEDVKNTILSKIIIRHPKWVKPLSVLIEIISVIIVIIAIWAVLTAIKSLLALWALGSCNVTKPSACSLGGEICSIDQQEPSNVIEATGRWFTEWGDIFAAIPDKFKTYNSEDYDFNYIAMPSSGEGDKPVAISIFDPGCSVCLASYLNEEKSGFFDKYEVRLIPFAIQNADGTYKFKNSGIVVRYMLASEQVQSGLAVQILEHIFVGKNEDGVSYQLLFNDAYSNEDAEMQIEGWLREDGLDDAKIAEIKEITSYPEITTKMEENKNIIENDLHITGIPTMIYDGSKHTGLYQAD
jgi:hypothetical protein